MRSIRNLEIVGILALAGIIAFFDPEPARAKNAPPGLSGPSVVGAVNSVLDDFHQAASDADEERYFGHLAPGAVFLGTDASERWTKTEFREFVHPYFSEARGWTYVPIERFVTLSADGSVAWFDEHLENSSYGTCRGTGALQFIDGTWKIEQYNLMIPVPNELTEGLVERIRTLDNHSE